MFCWVTGRRVVVLSLILLATSFVLVGSLPAVAQDREAVLMQKLRVLEARLEFFEKKLQILERVNSKEANEKAKAKREQPTAATTTTPGEPATATETTKRAAAETVLETKTPQETFVFRDQAPTLKKGKFEVSQDFNYQRSSGFLQFDRLFMSSSSIRYGLADSLEIGLTIPYYYSVRSTASIGSVFEGVAHGIGAATFVANYALLEQTPDFPGIALSGSVIYPGERAPYDFSGYALGLSPVEVLHSIPSGGHWGLGINVVAYKVVDPVVLYGGGGLQYFIPRTFFGFEVQPAIRYQINMGLSLALSEKTTVALDFRGYYSEDFKVSGVKIPQSFQEQFIGRIIVVQRVAQELWVEPSLGIGLTKESPDLNVGLGIRKRF